VFFLNKKMDGRDLGFLGLVVLILLVTVFALRGMDASPAPTWADIRSLIETQQVTEVRIKDNVLTMKLKQPWNGQDTVTAKLYSTELFYLEFNDTLAAQDRAGILTDYDYPPAATVPWWVSFLPWVGILGLFALLWYNMMTRQAGGGGSGGGPNPGRFSRARTRFWGRVAPPTRKWSR